MSPTLASPTGAISLLRRLLVPTGEKNTEGRGKPHPARVRGGEPESQRGASEPKKIRPRKSQAYF